MIFNEASYTLLYKIKIDNKSFIEICPTAELINITLGMEKNELILLFSNGEVFSTRFTIKDQVIEFSNIIYLRLSIDSEIFKDSHMFLPLYYNKDLIGVVLSNDNFEEIEGYWIFLYYNQKVLKIPLDANYLKVFPKRNNEPLSILVINENSIFIFKIELFKNFKIEDIIYEIPLKINEPIDLLNVSFNNKTVVLWTNDKRYRYSTEYGYLKEIKLIPNQIEDIITEINQNYLIYIQNNKLIKYQISTKNSSQPTLIDSSFNPLDINYYGEVNSINLIDGKAWILCDDDQFYFFRYFFDRVPVYIVTIFNKRKKTFFKQLEDYPDEIRKRYDSAFKHWSESYKNQLESISARSFTIYKPKNFITKEMDEEILKYLYIDKTFSEFAQEFNKNETNFILYVMNNFGSPRCESHNRFNMDCRDCIKNLDKWRKDGFKKIKKKNYRTSNFDHEIVSYSCKIRNTFHLTQKRKALREGFIKLLEIQKELNFSEGFFEEALKYFAECLKYKLTMGRSYKEFISSCIYLVYLLNKQPIPIENIIDSLDISKKKIFSTLQIIKTQILPKLKIKIKAFNPLQFVESITEKLELSENVKIRAKDLLINAEKNGYILQGKDPKGCAAGAIYLVAKRFDERRTQEEICSISRITAVTLRNRVKDLKNYFYF